MFKPRHTIFASSTYEISGDMEWKTKQASAFIPRRRSRVRILIADQAFYQNKSIDIYGDMKFSLSSAALCFESEVHGSKFHPGQITQILSI